MVNKYGQNSKEYQELIDSFINKFIVYFGSSNITIEEIRKLFFKKLCSTL